MSNSSVLIVGGYGVVGSEIARLLRRLYPDLELIIAGRTADKAEHLAKELGNARGIALDINKPPINLPADIQPDVILSAVTDQQHGLLELALSKELGYADFAKSGQMLMDAINITLQGNPAKGIAFISNWMAGVPSILAKEIATEFDTVEDVDLDILYYGDDRGGPDTGGAVEEFAAPFLGRRNGTWKTVKPMRDARTVTFPSGLTRKVQLLNIPDVTSLAFATKATNVHVRLGLDSAMDTFLSSLIVRSGIWHLLPRATKEAILFNPGEGAVHELIVTVRGKLNGQDSEKKVALLAPQGQVQLTAIGASHAVERILGLDNYPSLRPGPAFSEAVGNPKRLRALLSMEGIQVIEK